MQHTLPRLSSGVLTVMSATDHPTFYYRESMGESTNDCVSQELTRRRDAITDYRLKRIVFRESFTSIHRIPGVWRDMGITSKCYEEGAGKEIDQHSEEGAINERLGNAQVVSGGTIITALRGGLRVFLNPVRQKARYALTSSVGSTSRRPAVASWNGVCGGNVGMLSLLF
eukprot:IDg22070t1